MTSDGIYMMVHFPFSAHGLFFLSGECMRGSFFSFSSTYSRILFGTAIQKRTMGAKTFIRRCGQIKMLKNAIFISNIFNCNVDLIFVYFYRVRRRRMPNSAQKRSKYMNRVK